MWEKWLNRVFADCSAFCFARLPAEGANFCDGEIRSSVNWLLLKVISLFSSNLISRTKFEWLPTDQNNFYVYSILDTFKLYSRKFKKSSPLVRRILSISRGCSRTCSRHSSIPAAHRGLGHFSSWLARRGRLILGSDCLFLRRRRLLRGSVSDPFFALLLFAPWNVPLGCFIGEIPTAMIALEVVVSFLL